MNAVSERAPRIISRPDLEWPVLPGETHTGYTNFVDASKFDTSALVAMVNANPERNFGRADWRLPTIDELETLKGAAVAPADGWFWPSTSQMNAENRAWGVYFPEGFIHTDLRGLTTTFVWCATSSDWAVTKGGLQNLGRSGLM